MQVHAFPGAHWPHLRTTDGLDRLHSEIKRRIRAMGALPDHASALHLITAVARRTTQASVGRRYLSGLDPLGPCSTAPLRAFWRRSPACSASREQH